MFRASDCRPEGLGSMPPNTLRVHTDYVLVKSVGPNVFWAESRVQECMGGSDAVRAAEAPEQSQARRLQHATYTASKRDTETIEAAKSRKRAVAERAQQRRLIFTKNTWGVFDKAAFEYDETLDYESHKLIKIEAMNKECRFCGALKWKEESASMCCLGGSSHNLNWRGQWRQCSYTTHPNHTK
ncbi:uncharacterized protein TNCV_4359761 [Trichonephila clavipes]|uniref:Uncharacterized protein n=1 Tax=Trichonephila clavipes TaxID=2585209 RepID=A0A8X7BHX7_TRICX|nr:uncharacterized protein TNCV_4359761 [Trichonephila clavipes]